MGGVFGGLIGGAMPLAGSAINKARDYTEARKVFNDWIKSIETPNARQALDTAAVNTKYAEQGALPLSYTGKFDPVAERVVNARRFAERQTTPYTALPPSRGEQLLNQYRAGANQTGEGVIYGQGRTVYDDPNLMQIRLVFLPVIPFLLKDYVLQTMMKR